MPAPRVSSVDKCTTRLDFGWFLRNARGKRSLKEVAPRNDAREPQITKLSNWETGKNLPESVEALQGHLERLGIPEPSWGDYVTGFQRVDAAERRSALVRKTMVAASPTRLASIVTIPAIPRPPYVGRAVDRAAIASFLAPSTEADSQSALIVSGLGGIGKTALVLEAASSAVESGTYPGGNYYVDLGGYSGTDTDRLDEASIFRGAISVLEGDAPPTEATVRELQKYYHQLLDARAEGGAPVLIILDNVAPGSKISGLLPRRSRHRLVITSRDVLNLPLVPRVQRLQAMEISDSAALLHAVAPRLQGSVSDDSARDELLAFCAGLPLAIRIAGSVLESDAALSLMQFNLELRQESNRVAALHHGDLVVRTVFERSYVRLDPPQSKALRELCSAPSTEFSLKSAEALLDSDPAATATMLRGLYSACLLEYGSTTERRAIHDLLRLFIREKLAGSSGEEGLAARQRLYAYFCDYLDDATSWVNSTPVGEPGELVGRFEDRAAANAWMIDEAGSMTAALRAAQEDGDLDTTWELGTNLSILFSLAGDRQQELAAARAAQAAVEGSSDNSRLLGVLNNLGLAQDSVGRHEEARFTFAEGICRARERGDWKNEAKLLVGLGSALRKDVTVFDNLGASLRTLEYAINLYRDHQDSRGSAFAETNLGITYIWSRQPQVAVPILQGAAARHRAAGQRRAEASTLINLALALESTTSDQSLLEEIAAAGVALSREVGDPHMTAQALYLLAGPLATQGRFDESAEALDEASAIFEDLEQWMACSGALDRLVMVKDALGDKSGKADTLARRIRVLAQVR